MDHQICLKKAEAEKITWRIESCSMQENQSSPLAAKRKPFQGQVSKGAVRIYREDMELDDETIIEKIMKKFGLSRKDAQGYVEPEPAKA